MVLKPFVDVVVFLPFLIFGIPPLVYVFVAAFPLVADVFHGITSLIASPAVVRDYLLPLEFGLLTVAAAFGEIVVGVKARGCRERHKPGDERGGENGLCLKYEARITLRKQWFLLNLGGR